MGFSSRIRMTELCCRGIEAVLWVGFIGYETDQPQKFWNAHQDVQRNV